MTRTLISDLLFPGGGVETELLRLHDALDAAQESTDAPRDEGVARAPEFQEHTTGAPSLLDAYYAFWNLLAVRERIDRPYKSSRTDRVGLLPALAPGPLSARVQEALNTFRDRTQDTRYLSTTCCTRVPSTVAVAHGPRSRPRHQRWLCGRLRL